MNTHQANIRVVDLSSYLPPRTQLNNIAPIGQESFLVESLTSYIARLANSHCLPVGVLMQTEIAPIVDKVHGGANLHKIYNHTSALNSTGVMAFNLVQALEKLSGQKNLDLLTLSRWSNLLPQRNLLRRHRAWCPACYQEWYSTGQVVYERLLWFLEVVKVCPLHRCLLRETCPCCRQKNLCLAWHARPGYCSKCQEWLGLVFNSSFEELENLSQDDLETLVWISESVEDLLAYTSCLAVPLTKKDIAQAFTVHIDTVSNGNIAAFARQLQLPRNTVWLWCNGKNLPQLETLVQICYRLNRSLVDFITQAPEQNIYVTAEKVPAVLQSRPKAEARVINTDWLERELEVIFLKHDCPPQSMEEVARQLDIHRETIFRLFPEICRAISRKYDRFQKVCHQQAIEQSLEEVKQTVLELYNAGLYPSEGRVAQMMSRPGYLRYKQVRAAIAEAKLALSTRDQDLGSK
ncbi:TniQ family protein [Microcoleus sp. FACHB-1515]|uniref:TniQ family protein n=1 Tax=Cyanophyceae TaxID=3028117 RepID=UPI00168848DA|nr:TniQ family protein [Microcoleus sp. FACHB-1515]MBD2089121.1 TniQ family protein [Microcoleus sp. FACHB-1515]